ENVTAVGRRAGGRVRSRARAAGRQGDLVARNLLAIDLGDDVRLIDAVHRVQFPRHFDRAGQRAVRDGEDDIAAADAGDLADPRVAERLHELHVIQLGQQIDVTEEIQWN